MSVVQRKAMLKSDGFFPHKKNAKGTTIIYSRKHPTAKFVRVVVDSGIDSKTNKVVSKVGIKLCFVNRTKSWREITTQVFTTNTGLAKTIKAIEAAEKFVKSCKYCKAKKFTAKSGNVVCSNACWTNKGWSSPAHRAKYAGTKKKKPQKSKASPSLVLARKKAAARHKKKSQKSTPQSRGRQPATHQGPHPPSIKSYKGSSQKKSQKIVAEILPGDLVTVEEVVREKVTEDFTGKILGVVMSADKHGRVTTNWTANTSKVEEWLLPRNNNYRVEVSAYYRFKVLSRKAEWTKVT